MVTGASRRADQAWEGEGSSHQRDACHLLNTFLGLICLYRAMWNCNTAGTGPSDSIAIAGAYTRAAGEIFTPRRLPAANPHGMQ